LRVTPPGDQQLARQRPDAHLAGALAVVGEAPRIPRTQRAVGLPAPPSPSQLYQPPADRLGARLAAPRLPTARARLRRRWRQTHDGPHLPALGELPPGKQLEDQHPRAAQAHPRPLHQATDLVPVRRVVGANPLLTLVRPFLDVLLGQLPA